MTSLPLSPDRERPLVLLLAGIQFCHIVDFMVLMPLGPQLMRLLAISPAQFGLLVSAYTLAAGLTGFAFSFVADRFDRRPLLLGLFAGFLVATLACGLATSFGTLLAARLLAGAFGSIHNLEKASEAELLIPDLSKATFDNVGGIDGWRLMLWGAFVMGSSPLQSMRLRRQVLSAWSM